MWGGGGGCPVKGKQFTAEILVQGKYFYDIISSTKNIVQQGGKQKVLVAIQPIIHIILIQYLSLQMLSIF